MTPQEYIDKELMCPLLGVYCKARRGVPCVDDTSTFCKSLVDKRLSNPGKYFFLNKMQVKVVIEELLSLEHDQEHLRTDTLDAVAYSPLGGNTKLNNRSIARCYKQYLEYEIPLLNFILDNSKIEI